MPGWIIAQPFLTEVEIIEYNLQGEITDLTIDLESKRLFKNVTLSFFWTNIKTAGKCPILPEALLPLFLHFQAYTWLNLFK